MYLKLSLNYIQAMTISKLLHHPVSHWTSANWSTAVKTDSNSEQSTHRGKHHSYLHCTKHQQTSAELLPQLFLQNTLIESPVFHYTLARM